MQNTAAANHILFIHLYIIICTKNYVIFYCLTMYTYKIIIVNQYL